MHLTDIGIRALKPPEHGQKLYRDDTLKGFGIRVSQGGSKTFVLMHGANRDLLKIGRFPIISLAQAREEAKSFLANKTLGRHQPKTISFEEARRLYLARSKVKNRPGTTQSYTHYLGHFRFGTTKLSDISRFDVSRTLDKLVDTPCEHFHAVVTIKMLFRWAVREGYLLYSPCEGLQPLKSRFQRDRVLSAAELKEVLSKSLVEPYPFGPIVSLLILLGQRRGETSRIRYDWISDNAMTITIPASVTKNKREHAFPYGEMTRDLIKCLPRLDDSPYLFPAQRERRTGQPATTFNGWSNAKKEFDAKLKDVAPWTLHDLRRTVATHMAPLGIPQIAVEKLFNHVSDGSQSPIAQIYNRYNYLAEMRDAIAKWEAYLTSLLGKP